MRSRKINNLKRYNWNKIIIQSYLEKINIFMLKDCLYHILYSNKRLLKIRFNSRIENDN